MTHLSDEFLLAYLDGQIEKSQASGVARLATANAEVSRRLVRLKRTQAQLVETFGALAGDTAPMPASPVAIEELDPKVAPRTKATSREADVSAGSQRGKTWPRVLFVGAVFVGGLFGGYGATFITGDHTAPPPKSTDRAVPVPVASWVSDIARFHAFFPRETLTPHPDAISNPELIRFQLTKVAEKALAPPDFTRQGYTLYRGQVFDYRQDRMMQLTYSSKTEPPLTFYILRGTDAPDSPIAVHVQGANRAVSWISDQVRFFMTCDKSEEDLKLLAVIAEGQIPKKR
jgi:anti-sigma factor RsiW